MFKNLTATRAMLFESLTRGSPVNTLLTLKAAFTQTIALCLKKGQPCH